MILELLILVYGRITCLMGEALSTLQMEMFMKVSFNITKLMDLVFKQHQMALCIKVIGKKISNMALVLTNGQMENHFKAL